MDLIDAINLATEFAENQNHIIEPGILSNGKRFGALTEVTTIYY